MGGPGWSLDLHGSIVRTIPHSGARPDNVSPAGVVASFYAMGAG
jgi:hypothetical protein